MDLWKGVCATGEGTRYEGAHRFLESALYRSHGPPLVLRRRKHTGTLTGMSMGIEVDRALRLAVQAVVNGRSPARGTPVEKAAASVLRVLKTRYDFVPVDTQRTVTMQMHRISPVLDLVGVTSTGVPVIVELKCGVTAGKDEPTGHATHFRAPMDAKRDTYRNRAFAQLAVQRAAVMCASKRARKQRRFRGLVSLLACVGPTGRVSVLKLDPDFNCVERWVPRT
jgi:hypothetical protein